MIINQWSACYYGGGDLFVDLEVRGRFYLISPCRHAAVFLEVVLD